MARPRAFDTDAALDGAMNVFWAKGYDGANLPDLLTGMGITRGSLYKAFRDKKTLFMAALERYEKSAVESAVQRLTDPAIADGWDRIEALFQGIVGTVEEGDRRGCLICTAAAGPAMIDPDIKAAVTAALAGMRDAFGQALGASPTLNGSSDTDIERLADLLTTHYVGLRVLARSGATVDTLRQSVAALRLVRPQA